MATFSQPRGISALALCSWCPGPGLYSTSSECICSTGGLHAVSILYPWASPQQWPTWESRPGGGINQLPPSLGGLLPVHHLRGLGWGLLGSFPMRACWNSQRWELCGFKSLQRSYILLGNLTRWPPSLGVFEAPKRAFRGQRKQKDSAKLDFCKTFFVLPRHKNVAHFNVALHGGFDTLMLSKHTGCPFWIKLFTFWQSE